MRKARAAALDIVSRRKRNRPHTPGQQEESKMRVHLSAPNVIRKAVSAVSAGALAFALLGGSALAAPPTVRDHVASSTAGAANVVCEGSVCTTTSVVAYVNSPDGPLQVCLDITRYDKAGPSGFIPLGYETGCTPLVEGALAIESKGLASAALAPIDVTLQAFTCDLMTCTPTGATRSARVSASYVGVGDINTFRSNGKSTFGGCTMYFGGKGSSREASATLLIDGHSLAATGSLGTSTQKIKVLCH